MAPLPQNVSVFSNSKVFGSTSPNMNEEESNAALNTSPRLRRSEAIDDCPVCLEKAPPPWGVTAVSADCPNGPETRSGPRVELASCVRPSFPKPTPRPSKGRATKMLSNSNRKAELLLCFHHHLLSRTLWRVAGPPAAQPHSEREGRTCEPLQRAATRQPQT